MLSISKVYGSICKKKYQALGYSNEKGNTFARIKNDVLQVFSLKKYENLPIVTIEFGIIPLCMSLPTALTSNFPILSMISYRLDQFFAELLANDEGWRYLPNSNASMHACVVSLTQAIDSYLIPLLERCVDCSSSLIELIKLEKMFDDNRLNALALLGEKDTAKPWENESLFDTKKYFMALKSGDYIYAHKFLTHQVDFFSCEVQKSLHTNQPPIVLERISQKLSYYCEQLRILQSGNRGYFEKLVQTNEETMKTMLRARYPKLFV